MTVSVGVTVADVSPKFFNVKNALLSFIYLIPVTTVDPPVTILTIEIG